MVGHALTLVEPGGIIAAVAQAKFLFSQSRWPIFGASTMERVIVFSGVSGKWGECGSQCRRNAIVHCAT
jgi:hypothetical protein